MEGFHQGSDGETRYRIMKIRSGFVSNSSSSSFVLQWGIDDATKERLLDRWPVKNKIWEYKPTQSAFLFIADYQSTKTWPPLDPWNRKFLEGPLQFEDDDGETVQRYATTLDGGHRVICMIGERK